MRIAQRMHELARRKTGDLGNYEFGVKASIATTNKSNEVVFDGVISR